MGLKATTDVSKLLPFAVIFWPPRFAADAPCWKMACDPISPARVVPKVRCAAMVFARRYHGPRLLRGCDVACDPAKCVT